MQQQVVHVLMPYLLGMYPDFWRIATVYVPYYDIWAAKRHYVGQRLAKKEIGVPQLESSRTGLAAGRGSASILHFHIGHGRVAVADTPQSRLAFVGSMVKAFRAGWQPIRPSQRRP